MKEYRMSSKRKLYTKFNCNGFSFHSQAHYRQIINNGISMKYSHRLGVTLSINFISFSPKGWPELFLFKMGFRSWGDLEEWLTNTRHSIKQICLGSIYCFRILSDRQEDSSASWANYQKKNGILNYNSIELWKAVHSIQ